MPLAPAYSYRVGETKSGKSLLREPASGIPAREQMVQEREPSLAQWTRMAARRSHSSCNITVPANCLISTAGVNFRERKTPAASQSLPPWSCHCWWAASRASWSSARQPGCVLCMKMQYNYTTWVDRQEFCHSNMQVTPLFLYSSAIFLGSGRP